MACAHAKFTGEVGVCLATSGPGAIHLLNGLYDARWTTSRWWRSSASRRAVRSAATTSRRSTCPRCSRTSPASTCSMVTSPAQVRHLVDRAVRIALAERTVTCVIVPNDLQEEKAVETAAARTARSTPASATTGRRSLPTDDSWSGCGGAQRRRAGGDARRRGRPRSRGRGDRDRRPARRRRREGAARQGGAARRPALGHRVDRPARHPAELGDDGRLRHAADGRLQLPLRRVPAQGRSGARACRSTSTGACSGSATRWRCLLGDAGDAAGAVAAASPEDRQRLARRHRAQRRRLVAAARTARHEERRPDQPAARVPGALAAAARRRDPDLGFRLGRQLVRPRHPDPRGHDGDAVGQPGDDGAGRAVRDRRQVRLSATGR